MKGLLPWVLLILAVLAISAKAEEEVSDQDIDFLADKVLKALDRQVDRMGEPQVEDDDDDEAPRALGIGSAIKSIGKKLASLVKNIWSKISKDRIKKAVKSTIVEVKNTIKEKGKEKLKELKQKLIKEGKKQAKSFLKHEILKFIKKKASHQFCSCPSALKCGCCIHPPALEQGCFNMTALPEEQKFRIALNYGGEKVVGRKISGTKEMMSCTNLPTPLNLVEICIVTQGIQQIDELNYKGCFRIVSHGLEVAKCVSFQDGKASLS